MRDEFGAMPILEGLAEVGAAQDAPMVAAQLAGYAAALREAFGIPHQPSEQPEYDRTVATLRARLDPEPFVRAWNEGKEFSLERALTVAKALRTSDGDANSALAQRSTPQIEPPPITSFALTRREIDVLRLLTFGLTYAQIAEILVISPRTVDAHVRAIYSKLDVRSRSAATRVALQNSLV
jgi:DNA-binding CsgD family transcriptional regulator